MQMQPQMQIMTVTVPAGVPIGGNFLIATPDGQQMQVQAQVPEGQQMQIQVPMAQPAMAVAQPVQPMQPVAQPMQPGAPVAFQPGQPMQQAPMVTVPGYPAQMMTIQAPQVVQGIPLDPTMFVTSTLGLNVDPVPMLDAQTAGILNSVNKFKVKQRLAIWEAITQGACEQQNVYDIYDDKTGAPLFTAIEDSDGCTRCCCAPYHSFLLKFKPAAPGVNRNEVKNTPTLMTMEREGCCSKWGLGCFACNDDCKDGFVLHAGDVTGEPGQTMMSSGRVIGYATQPKCGGYMTPTINVMERMDETGGKWGALAKIEGPTFFGGCSELCCESEWPVSRMTAEGFDEKLKIGDFAVITKHKPNGCGAALQEALTDSDTYTIEFNEGVALAPQQKALMMASLVQIDFMFFEKDNGMCKSEGGKIKITLFECYCCGCTCPCNLEGGGEGGGGGAPPNREMPR